MKTLNVPYRIEVKAIENDRLHIYLVFNTASVSRCIFFTCIDVPHLALFVCSLAFLALSLPPSPAASARGAHSLIYTMCYVMNRLWRRVATLYLSLPLLQNKMYSRDFLQVGRARIQLKNTDGSLVNPNVPNSSFINPRLAHKKITFARPLLFLHTPMATMITLFHVLRDGPASCRLGAHQEDPQPRCSLQ